MPIIEIGIKVVDKLSMHALSGEQMKKVDQSRFRQLSRTFYGVYLVFFILEILMLMYRW